ncbi:hypothetical protein L1049_012810 [Liquidambar formosana]|uniref:DRBM domain-containing protein n=1 Tax=Liquidambar formosana TaxID=63359 RepID=A0AAP0RL26_LIQFO
MKDGPDHSPCFKASVSVNGVTFVSPNVSSSSKQAHNDAARHAFTLLTSPSSDAIGCGYSFYCIIFQDDSRFYKNLLQELAQKEGFCLPSYKTFKAGAPHMPKFYSSVEVEGEIFQGKGAKSKKQAEIDAAKTAYTVFKERELSRSVEFNSPSSPADEASESTPGLDSLIPVELLQNQNPGVTLVSSPPIKCEESAVESEDVVVLSAENLSANAKVSSRGFNPSLLVPDINNLIGIKNPSSYTESVSSSPKEGPLSSPTLTPPDLSVLSMEDTNMGKITGPRSYLLCNRFRVYPCIPDITFPEGITLLPISDDKWVAVSLEFPNEKST